MAGATPPPKPEGFAHYVKVLGQTQERAAPPPVPDGSDIDTEVARRKKLQNDDVEQNIRLKRIVLNRLFWFLGIETFLIFSFTFCQATRIPFGFELKEWSFNILITATILQIAGMLLVAVRYLFPTKGDD